MVLIKKGLGKYAQHIPGKIKMHELQKITLLGTSHILRTLHQIDFYLILTLGSRNGLGYSVVLWYSIKKDNNNNNNNNNFSVAHWHTFVMSVLADLLMQLSYRILGQWHCLVREKTFFFSFYHRVILVATTTVQGDKTCPYVLHYSNNTESRS